MTQAENAVSFDATISRRPKKSPWILAIAPAAFVVLALGGQALPEATANVFYRAVLVVAATLAGGSALLTTRRFVAGDKLFLGWAAFGVGYLLSSIRHGIRLWSVTTGAAMPPQTLLDGMMIVQNILVALALLWFVLAWRSTGLASPVERSTEVRWILIGAAVALAVGGYPLIRGFGNVATNPAMLVSTVGDIVGLALIVPLMLPALAMRGGALMHTWLLLALSEMAWLGYDIWTAGAPGIQISVHGGRGVTEIFRLLAVSLALSATIAQRRAIR
jgi:hypothetical protein